MEPRGPRTNLRGNNPRGSQCQRQHQVRANPDLDEKRSGSKLMAGKPIQAKKSKSEARVKVELICTKDSWGQPKKAKRKAVPEIKLGPTSKWRLQQMPSPSKVKARAQAQAAIRVTTRAEAKANTRVHAIVNPIAKLLQGSWLQNGSNFLFCCFLRGGGRLWPKNCGTVCCHEYQRLLGECRGHLLAVFFDRHHLKSQVGLHYKYFVLGYYMQKLKIQKY